MKKPTLLHTTTQGGTIHAYDIEGGKSTFHRFLACQEGYCIFYNSIEEAKKSID